MAEPTRSDGLEQAAGVRAAVRGFVVVLGGSVVSGGAAAASMLALTRALAQRRRPSPLALAGSVALAAYVVKGRPWLRWWGATRAETKRSFRATSSCRSRAS